MASSMVDSDLKTMAASERAAIKFLDGQIEVTNRANFADVIFLLNSDDVPEDVRDYIGDTPSSIGGFIHRRGHLWRKVSDGIQMLPSVLRIAIIDLVASIVKNKNRAPLGEIFGLLQTYHHQALPYLPTPTNGSSLDAVKTFVLNYPHLFRLINAADGNEWTRTTPLGQVVVECISVVVDGVILLDVKPAAIASTSPQKPTPLPTEVEGIGEIVRVTPVWGYLQSEEHGFIFFTSAACGGESLHAKGLKLGNNVYYEARQSEAMQVYNNVPVKLRAHNVRLLTAADKAAAIDTLTLVSSSNNLPATTPPPATPVEEPYASRQSPSSSPISTSSAPKSGPPFTRLPGSLADWMKRRHATTVHEDQATANYGQQRARSPQAPPGFENMDAELLAIEDELNIGAVGAGGSTNGNLDLLSGLGLTNPIPAVYHNATTNGQRQRASQGADATGSMLENEFISLRAALSNGVQHPRTRDVACQTNVTDEELLLRLIRQMPEMLNLVQLVMRR